MLIHNEEFPKHQETAWNQLCCGFIISDELISTHDIGIQHLFVSDKYVIRVVA